MVEVFFNSGSNDDKMSREPQEHIPIITMEKLKLKFDTDSGEGTKEYVVDVPYKDGIVITSEFCPTELISENIDLLAAFRGEPIDKFMSDCRKQVLAMSQIKEAETSIDRHIGGLMAVVMDHLSRNKVITYGDLLIYVDCFALLLKGAGFEDKEIHDIYPRVIQTIKGLYSDYILSQTSK